MTDGNVELVPVAGIREGDIVLNPKLQMWMRVARVELLPATIHSYEKRQGWRTEREPHRRITMYRLDRLPIETPIPYVICFRDIEESLPRWKGADLPPQES